MKKEVELGEICDLINGDRGKNYPSQSTLVSKGIPFINAGCLENKRIEIGRVTFITREHFNKLSGGKIKKGDILFCLRGSLGKFAINDNLEEGAIASSLVIIRPNEDVINLSYLGHFLDSPTCETLISKNDNGSSQPNLSAASVKKFTIPLPPLPEQQRIARLLDLADGLRQKQQQLLLEYDRLLESVFLEMFGDPVKNEKGWEETQLGSVCSKIGSGATPSGGKESYLDSGISLIRSLNVYDNDFKYKDLAFISDGQAEKLKNVIVKANDVLFNITGASVCRCTIVPPDILPARVNQHVAILRPKEKLLNSIFLCHNLISENVKSKLLNISGQGGATREAITKEGLVNFTIILPPLELQNRFAAIVENIEGQKAKAQAQLDAAEGLFGGLLQGAF